MAIQSLDDFIASARQTVYWYKKTKTVVAGYPYSMHDAPGNPGAAASLAIGNTANGIVPTSADSGYKKIDTISNTGYIGSISYNNYNSGIMSLYDRLFAAGAYSYNADTSLTSQPSYSARVPNTNYNSLELWIETVTTFTGTPSFQINYLDQDGNAGDTGAVSAGAAMAAGRCFAMPLAAGDSGIQQITRVRGTVASAGTFNVMVLRHLWTNRVQFDNAGDIDDVFKTGLKQIYDTSALYVLVTQDSTAAGYPVVYIDIRDG
jgi:hypothetical protein